MLLPSRLPIVQAPMAGGPSTPELAAAVAAAGGFGYLAAGYLSPDALETALRRTRDLSAASIGVNLFVPGPPAEDRAAITAYAERLAPLAERLGAHLGEPRWDDDAFDAKVELVASAGVHTVSFPFRCPTPDVLHRLRAAGARTAVTVTNADEATVAAEAGADALIVQGTEAGGHQGIFDGHMPNATPLVDALGAIKGVDLPMIAADGIMTSDDASTALAAGAEAVQLGTALLCTPEAATSAPHRRALLDARYQDTVVTRAFSGRWARGLANALALQNPDAPAGYPEVHHLTRPLRAAATKAGNPDVPNLWAGTGWRQVIEAPAGEVVRRVAAGL